MSKWTKEPWSVDCLNNIWAYGAHKKVCGMSGLPIQSPNYDPMTVEENEANAERIVSCVNNCTGLNPSAIKDVVEALEIVKTTLPHIGGNERSVHTLMQGIETALSNIRRDV